MSGIARPDARPNFRVAISPVTGMVARWQFPASRQGGSSVPPMPSKYTSTKSAIRYGNGQSNTPETNDNGWEIPLESEETIFIERRISHYGAMLKLTLEAEDRVKLIRMLVDAEWKLATRKLYLPKAA
jgi:hypothetical protein